MDPISTNQAPAVQPTSAPPLPEADGSAPPPQKPSAQQVPQTDVIPTDGDTGFTLPGLLKPESPADIGTLLQTLSIMMEKSQFTSVKQDLRDYLDGTKLYADARGQFIDLQRIASESMKSAGQIVANFLMGPEAEVAKARNEAAALSAEIQTLRTESAHSGTKYVAEISALEGKLANAEGRVSDARIMRDRIEALEKAEADRLWLTALVIAKEVKLDTADHYAIFGAVLIDEAIPVSLIGELAGPDAKAAAQRAVAGVEKLKEPLAYQGPYCEDYFAKGEVGIPAAIAYTTIVQMGEVEHPSEAAFRALEKPEDAEAISGRIMAAIYQSEGSEGELGESDDLLDRIALTIESVTERFSAQDAGENNRLDFLNQVKA